jgi:hypothetical protein
MGRRPCPRAVLDPDQAAALHCLVAAFGIEQITVTAIQGTEPPDQNPAAIQAPAQASLLGEAS